MVGYIGLCSKIHPLNFGGYERQIKAVDATIDRLVAARKLYGLTEREKNC